MTSGYHQKNVWQRVEILYYTLDVGLGNMNWKFDDHTKASHDYTQTESHLEKLE